MKRHTRLALETVGGVFGLVALLTVAAAVVLANGSVELDFLAPYLAASLSNPTSGVQVTIGQARLALAEGPRLEIMARGVELRVGTAGPQVALPELAVDLSLRAALGGVIAPTRITLDEPQLRLARDPDGEFHLGFDSAQGAAPDTSLGQILRDLSGPPDPSAPAGALTELTIHRAGFLFDDRALGVTWRANADLALHRDARGLRGDVTLSDSSARPAALRAEIDYVRAAARVEAQLDFRDLLPASWAPASQALTPLKAIDLPITGVVRATLDPERGAIVAASCDLKLGAGAWRDPALADGAVAISDGAIVASYDPAQGRILLDTLALRLGGPNVLARGTIDGVGGGLLAGGWPPKLDAALTVDTSDVPIAAVPHLWPPPVSPRARHWVLANVHSGAVERMTAQLGLHIDLDAADSVALRSLAGTIEYRDLTVDTFGKLPPVTGIGGTGTFGLAEMVLQPARGSLLGLAIGNSKVSLTRLDIPDSRVAIDLAVTGPIKDALAVLDAEPLNYLRALNITPTAVAGAVDGHVRLAFPLVDRVEPRQIEAAADATLSDIAMPKALFGRDVSAGGFKLRLDREAVALDGTAALAGVPVAVAVRRALADTAATPLSGRFSARLDEAGRRALGVDFFTSEVTGPVGVDVAYAAGAGDAAEAQVALDLTDSGLAIPLLDWAKARGSTASARFAASLKGGALASLHDVVLQGGGLEARLAASIEDGGLARLDVARLALGATDASGSLVRRADGGWHVTVEGAGFDATGLLDLMSHAAPDRDREPPFELDAKLDRVVLGSEREARSALAHLVSDGDHWQTATADATLASGAPVRLRYGAVGGKQHFSLRSDDFGGLLHLVGVAHNVRGGRIQVTGNAVDDGPRRRLKLAVEGEDFRLANAPMVARLLSIGSFSAMLSLLSGDGIPFSRLSATVLYGADRVEIDDFRTYGSVIGVNASGAVDQQARSIDVTGTLVPSFRLNTVLGDIPKLGSLLLGGEGQGLFGANFRIAGAIDNPTVSVNMLSALAPGALRNLFRF